MNMVRLMRLHTKVKFPNDITTSSDDSTCTSIHHNPKSCIEIFKLHSQTMQGDYDHLMFL